MAASGDLGKAIRKVVTDKNSQELARRAAKQAGRMALKSNRLAGRAAQMERLASLAAKHAGSLDRLTAPTSLDDPVTVDLGGSEVALAVDAVMGQMVFSPNEPIPHEWKSAITAMAERMRNVLRRYPWVLSITVDPHAGPRALVRRGQALHALSELPGSLEDHLDVIATVDEFVIGHVWFEHRRGDKSISCPADELGLGDLWQTMQRHAGDEARFSRTLSVMLDGVEQAFSV